MINSIKIENFKSFKNETFEFKNITVFTGINGMGKSSSIQTLLLLRQSFVMGYLNNHGGLFLDGELSRPGNGKDIFFFDADEKDKIKFEILATKSRRATFAFDYKKDSDLQPLHGMEHDFDLAEINLFNGDFFYLNADRLSPERDIFPTSQSNISKGILGKNGQYTVHYIANNQRNSLFIKELKHKKAATDTLLENIERWMNDIAPGIKLAAQFYPEINAARLGFSYELGKGSTDEFKPINVGYGLTYILPVITQLLISKPGQIVIIENPESHLHPTGQSIIADLCVLAAQNGVQVVVETHSDHIINGILVNVNKHHKNKAEGISNDKVKIHFIDRESGSHISKTNKIEITEEGRIKNAPKNFFDQFTKDMKLILGF